MRKSIALAAVLLVGSFGIALAAPSADVGLPMPAITTLSHADAAIGRGGGAGEGARTQVGSRTASWLAGELIPLFFLIIAIALMAVSLQRNAGAAVAILVAAVVIGAFLLVPDSVEAFFRTIYNLVL
ncbi:MAG TPA: hypothetical protein VF245_00480 [Solirubrobacterales bacterium]